MIDAKTITRYLRTEPFQPFRLRATNGEFFKVVRPQDVVVVDFCLMLGLDIDPETDIPTRGVTLALNQVVTVEPLKENLPIPTEPGHSDQRSDD